MAGRGSQRWSVGIMFDVQQRAPFVKSQLHHKNARMLGIHVNTDGEKHENWTPVALHTLYAHVAPFGAFTPAVSPSTFFILFIIYGGDVDEYLRCAQFAVSSSSGVGPNFKRVRLRSLHGHHQSGVSLEGGLKTKENHPQACSTTPSPFGVKN